MPDVLVDTPIWLLALRRRTKNTADPAVAELESLIRDMNARIMGPIRQEILSGLKNSKDFESLRSLLRAFPDIRLDEQDHERAAEIYNKCRSAGIQGSNTDFLICAVAERYELAVFTTDQGFTRYRKYSKFLVHTF